NTAIVTIAAAIEESARLRARLLALERIGTDLNKTVRRMVISMVTIAVLHSAWHAWRWYNNKEKQDKAS
ncbi:hypothetical protein M1466_01460, partial [Candidatus Dependentiae bacterium]|nr:hypothetical protein [Candidatus Dependentiae bacterium]